MVNIILIWYLLEDVNLDNIFIENDGTTHRTTGETVNLLRDKFPDRVISRSG